MNKLQISYKKIRVEHFWAKTFSGLELSKRKEWIGTELFPAQFIIFLLFPAQLTNCCEWLWRQALYYMIHKLLVVSISLHYLFLNLAFKIVKGCKM